MNKPSFTVGALRFESLGCFLDLISAKTLREIRLLLCDLSESEKNVLRGTSEKDLECIKDPVYRCVVKAAIEALNGKTPARGAHDPIHMKGRGSKQGCQ